MSFEAPGLDKKPDAARLIGFASLMPPDEKKPGLVSRVVNLPVKIIALPFKAVGAVFRVPVRIFSRGNRDKVAKA